MAPLRPLALEPIVPPQQSSVEQALSAIKKIDIVRVVLNPGRPPSEFELIVETFTGRVRSGSPVLNSHSRHLAVSASTAPRWPTSTVTRSFDDFTDLRQRLREVVRKAHKSKQCDFCRDMIKYALWGNAQPGPVVRLFGGDEKVLHSLTKFIGDLVARVESGCSPAAGGSICRARTKLLLVVHDFLIGSSNEGS